jgi:hypothetical protein
MKEDRTVTENSLSKNYIVILMLACIVSAFPGCETYTKKTQSCKNGVCTTRTVKCVAGVCTTTTCRKGNCVVTYSGTQSSIKDKESKEKTVDITNSESVKMQRQEIVYKPTTNHQVFMKHLDGFAKASRQLQGETSAMTAARKSKYEKTVFRKTSFKKLCLKDVEPSCAFGGDDCKIYTATFYLPLSDSAGCEEVSVEGYHAPEIIKHNVCKNEAMKYRPGKKYNVSGKVDIYYFYNPEDDGDNSFIRKYFTRTNKLELDNTNFFKCVK